ncbi:MAG: hypothetical protein AAF430_22225 [Myxococcota bacterium]
MRSDLARKRQAGLSIVELVIVAAIIAFVTALAVPNFLRWSDDERVKSAARSVSDAFNLARSEAIRTGDNHLLIFGMALSATEPIVVVNDGPQTTANCTIDANEVVHFVAAAQGVNWGTSTGAANGTLGPDDAGALPANVATGWTFSDAGGANTASWILFQADGIPRTFTASGGACTAIGTAGQGGGGIYLTNNNRDYAVVLRPLGTARVHKWDPNASAWSN